MAEGRGGVVNYSPPGRVPNPSVIFERVRASAFYDYLIKSNLKVNTIVGGHGVVGSSTI